MRMVMIKDMESIVDTSISIVLSFFMPCRLFSKADKFSVVYI
jgi:hypothetical protein